MHGDSFDAVQCYRIYESVVFVVLVVVVESEGERER